MDERDYTIDRTPDRLDRADCELHLIIYPVLEPRRMLWVIIPKAAANVVEEELVRIAKSHGKIKLRGEERPPALRNKG